MARPYMSLASSVSCRPWLSLGVAGGISIVVACGLSPAACRRDAPRAQKSTGRSDGQPWFEESSAPSNIEYEHVFAALQRYYNPELFSGGVGLLDYDGDGNLDIYFVQGGDLDSSIPDRPGNRMYRNRGDGTFEDVTASTRTGDNGYGMGCACGDYDGDGDVDLYVTNVGPNVLYRNNGDGTFSDVTGDAGVGDRGWGTSAAFADYDGDGNLDLFVVNYIKWSPQSEMECLSLFDQQDYCGPADYSAPAPDTLYRNTGRGSFVDVSKSAGLREVYGNGLGLAPGDFNGDGRLDFYVANDGLPNQLWINTGEGRFADDALMSGCALNHSGVAEAGMGVMAADVNYDGHLDLFMSHFRDETNTFYVNNAGLFDDVTATLGLGEPSFPFTGFGLGFADFDHDRDLDLFVANGRAELTEPMYDRKKPYAEPNQLFEGRGNLRFVEVSPRGGTAKDLVETTRAIALGDLDNDGDVDIVVVNNGARAHLLRNIASTRGNWIMFRVLNRRGGYALNASVRIRAGDDVQWRQVQRAYGYCSSNDPRVHFGLGTAARVDQVTVRWPDGREEEFGPFEAGRIHELRKGS